MTSRMKQSMNFSKQILGKCVTKGERLATLLKVVSIIKTKPLKIFIQKYNFNMFSGDLLYKSW
jgi:hypothetical protein